MASSNPLEDQISCAVCFDIYKDPHVLTGCLHTFCHECIQQMNKHGRVTCPECRDISYMDDIKKDFKMQGVVDAYNAQPKENVPMDISSALCGVCEVSDKPVNYHCVECEHYLCMDCYEGHRRIKACSNHTVKSISAMTKSVEEKLKDLCGKLRKAVSDVDSKLSEINQSIDSINTVEQCQLGELTRYTEDAIVDLHANKNRLEKTVKFINGKAVSYLENSKNSLEEDKKELQSNLDLIDDLAKVEDPVTFRDTAPQATQKMDAFLAKLHGYIDEVNPNVRSPIRVKRNEKWDVNGCMEVKVDNIMSGHRNMKLLLDVSYSDLHSNKYVETASTGLDYWPENIHKINGKIWCVGYSKMGIFESVRVVRYATHENIKGIRGLTRSHSNEIVIASDCGLHCMDIHANYPAQILKGRFASVCIYDGYFYALEWRTVTVMVFKYSSGTWIKDKEMKLQYKLGSHWDRLCVKKTNIYISSWDSKCVYIYDHQGELQYTIKQGNNRLLLCDVDDDSNILVVDRTSYQVKVYDSYGCWNVVELQGNIDRPMCAMVDQTGNIWIGKGGLGARYEMIRFSKV